MVEWRCWVAAAEKKMKGRLAADRSGVKDDDGFLG